MPTVTKNQEKVRTNNKGALLGGGLIMFFRQNKLPDMFQAEVYEVGEGFQIRVPVLNKGGEVVFYQKYGKPMTAGELDAVNNAIYNGGFVEYAKTLTTLVESLGGVELVE